jgi:hypothetical protein
MPESQKWMGRYAPTETTGVGEKWQATTFRSERELPEIEIPAS